MKRLIVVPLLVVLASCSSQSTEPDREPSSASKVEQVTAPPVESFLSRLPEGKRMNAEQGKKASEILRAANAATKTYVSESSIGMMTFVKTRIIGPNGCVEKTDRGSDGVTEQLYLDGKSYVRHDASFYERVGLSTQYADQWLDNTGNTDDAGYLAAPLTQESCEPAPPLEAEIAVEFFKDRAYSYEGRDVFHGVEGLKFKTLDSFYDESYIWLTAAPPHYFLGKYVGPDSTYAEIAFTNHNEVPELSVSDDVIVP